MKHRHAVGSQQIVHQDSSLDRLLSLVSANYGTLLAASMAVRRIAAATRWPRSRCGRRCWAAAMIAAGASGRWPGDNCPAWSAAIGERSFMKGASGERERASRPALSLGPHRLKSLPAVLSLSARDDGEPAKAMKKARPLDAVRDRACSYRAASLQPPPV